ncbi:unnamed protein product, partial [Polarella glacialis]
EPLQLPPGSSLALQGYPQHRQQQQEEQQQQQQHQQQQQQQEALQGPPGYLEQGSALMLPPTEAAVERNLSQLCFQLQRLPLPRLAAMLLEFEPRLRVLREAADTQKCDGALQKLALSPGVAEVLWGTVKLRVLANAAKLPLLNLAHALDALRRHGHLECSDAAGQVVKALARHAETLAKFAKAGSTPDDLGLQMRSGRREGRHSASAGGDVQRVLGPLLHCCRT